MGSLIQQLRNLSSWHMRGLLGSTVIGITKCGGVIFPTSPQTRREQLESRSKIVQETKLLKRSHEVELGKSCLGVFHY